MVKEVSEFRQGVHTLTGVVIKNKMDKTVVVQVKHKVMHSKGKRVLRSKNYAVHDHENLCKVGDTVVIYETKPISRTKKRAVYKNMTQEAG